MCHSEEVITGYHFDTASQLVICECPCLDVCITVHPLWCWLFHHIALPPLCVVQTGLESISNIPMSFLILQTWCTALHKLWQEPFSHQASEKTHKDRSLLLWDFGSFNMMLRKICSSKVSFRCLKPDSFLSDAFISVGSPHQTRGGLQIAIAENCTTLAGSCDRLWMETWDVGRRQHGFGGEI